MDWQISRFIDDQQIIVFMNNAILPGCFGFGRDFMFECDKVSFVKSSGSPANKTIDMNMTLFNTALPLRSGHPRILFAEKGINALSGGFRLYSDSGVAQISISMTTGQ